MLLPGGGGLGGSGRAALSPACPKATAAANSRATSGISRRISVQRAAIFGRGGEYLGAVSERDGAGINGVRAVLGAVSLHGDFIAGFETVLFPAAARQGVGIARLAGPMHGFAVLVGGIHIEVDVGVHPIEFGDHT